MENKVNGEQAYPQFSLRLNWKEVKNGILINNANNPYKMFKEFPTLVELMQWVEKQKYLVVKSRKGWDFTQKVEFLRYETWLCSWFQHETFDVGQSDDQALASFSCYVDRYARYQNDWKDPNYVCLMGAEDRWRWTGSGESGSPDERTNPPCRCKFCKEQGLIRIGH